MTSASPSTLTIACNREETRSIRRTYRPDGERALLAARRARLVDPHELAHLVPLRLIGSDNSFRPQVLQHAVVTVVGRAHLRHVTQCSFQGGDVHGLGGDGSNAGNEAESADRLAS